MPDTGWFKSSYSGAGNDQCVEVRLTGGRTGIRDSKNVDGGALWVDAKSWTAFVSRVRGGSGG
jgi:hypothetical protein